MVVINGKDVGESKPKSLDLAERLIRDHDKRVGIVFSIVYLLCAFLFILVGLAYGSPVFLIFVVGSLIGSLYFYRSYRKAAHA